MSKARIAILASGSGTNAEKIIEYFTNSNIAEVALVASNKETAKVLDRAGKHNIPHFSFNREQFYQTDFVLKKLTDKDITHVVLAGFLWLIPENLISHFPDKMLNIHPALLPKYGGKGMYGSKVHEAVVANKEKESGITIHLVNSQYDEGQILLQKSCRVVSSDTPEDVAKKVQILEHQYYPKVIADFIQKKPKKD